MMVKSEQQRQKKLARKKTKERQKKQLLAREKQMLASLVGKMTAAARGEIVDCVAGDMEAGMGTVLFSRRAPDGQVAMSIFLLDTYCLGVKNTIGRYVSSEQYREMADGLIKRQNLSSIRPELARGLVEASAEYAKSLGFSPHCDYHKLQPIWGDIEAVSVEGQYQFGLNGKPCFVNGPDDDGPRQNLIFRTLCESVGEGNFNFTIGGPMGMGGMLELDDVQEIDEDEVESLIVDGNVTTRRIDEAT